ncbi:MAG TPA: protein translocase subunit SecDF [Bacteroidia bacterium]|nr:protein translocase subunit SecDF [Bacteroidia bacterium]
MQNKGIVRLFAILLALACVYYFSFTYFSIKTENTAKQYAQDYISRASVVNAAKSFAKGDTVKQRFYIDSMQIHANESYMDSIKSVAVYPLLDFTYEDCKERSINLGLDLRGGMNVTLEISEADIIKKMSDNNNDVVFNKALAQAAQQHMRSTRPFIDLFGDAFQQLNPEGKLASYFQTVELKDVMPYNSTNDQVLSVIKDRVHDAIATAEKTLRVRIDKFGVTQPNIQLLPGSGRILVELPGVSDKERVRKLLQGTADLEFWETYENSEVFSYLQQANNRLSSIMYFAKDTAKKDTIGGKAMASVSDTGKKDTTKKLSLEQQLNKANNGDTSKGKVNTAPTASDTSIAAFSKKNPLFFLLRPNLQYDQKGQANGYSKGPMVGMAKITDTAKIDAMLRMPGVASIFPSNLRLMWTVKPFDKAGTLLQLVAIKVTTRNGRAPLYGDIITDARKEFEQQGQGHPQIAMTMTPQAALTWKNLTHDNVGRSIAIVLDDNVYSFPTVENEISGGRSSISGNFSVREADDLVNILKAGRLPAPAHIVEESVVGATLGQESIHSGLVSFIAALLIVLLFMALYYNQAGRIADVAMLVNVFFVLGVLASLGAVLTLPGIAGIVLTIAMSVDANILIFERVREELSTGKTLANAIKDGFRKAMSSVLDANVTTFILGIILYVYGTGPIQGFATTLIIGIPTSLFTAIFITRLIFERRLSKGKAIAFDTTFTRNAFKNININFVKRRHLYYVISGSILVAGFISFMSKGFELGVDFKGGRTYVVRFDNVPSVEKVRSVLAAEFKGEALEVQTYGENTQVKITTTYLVNDPSKNAQSMADEALRKGVDQIGHNQIISSDLVGEAVSQDIKSKAIWSVLFACLLMFIYIFIRFRGWQYGLGAVVALFHDALMIMAAFTLFKGVLPFSLEVNQDFIAAILTVMSYSMNDTVVVFDRIREYLNDKTKREKAEDKTHLINYALNATLSRTINTSLSIFFVLLAIFIFGGTTIKGFAFALLIGIVVGTYSSICIATPIVIDFDKKKKDTAVTK